MSRLPIIFDCDPGGDDAVMLLMAMASDALDILGITTIAGNVDVRNVTNNALRLVELARREDILVYEGCPRPILKPPLYATDIHGESGLEGSNMPPPRGRAHSKHAVDFIIDTLLSSEKKVTLSLSGPMTNLAVALIKTPSITDRIQEVVCMGGSTDKGNITPFAEFNFFVDPHAAHIVLSSGIPVRMIGLNVTHEVYLSDEHFRRLESMDTDVARELSSILRFGEESYRELGFDGRVIHDACIVAAILRPQYFEFVPRKVIIEHRDDVRIGQSLVEECQHGEYSHIQVALGVDRKAVLAFVLEIIQSY